MTSNSHNNSPGTLARWYATPLNQQQAEVLKQCAQQRRQQRFKRGPEGNTVSCVAILMEAIANFWLTGEIPAELNAPTSPLQKSAHGRILARTIRGQLLISRQITAGLPDLQQSFKLAAPLLKAGDYFLLMDRYKALERVPLSDRPQSGKTLAELLNLGGVVERLQKGERKVINHDPNDLYG